jgi:hypothetical protein
MNPALLAMLARSGLMTSAARTGIYDAANSYMKANQNIPEWQLRALQAYGKFDQKLFGPPGGGFRTKDFTPENLRAYLEADPVIQRAKARMAEKAWAEQHTRTWADIEQGR